MYVPASFDVTVGSSMVKNLEMYFIKLLEYSSMLAASKLSLDEVEGDVNDFVK